eukprot:scaffold5560_cov444-Prasinococcus_capsulatus_cf.AAC.12
MQCSTCVVSGIVMSPSMEAIFVGPREYDPSSKYTKPRWSQFRESSLWSWAPAVPAPSLTKLRRLVRLTRM